MHDEDYQWAFTPISLRTHLGRADFAVEGDVFLCEGCSDLSECDHAREYLLTAHCR
jgi:hypothetical protein